MAPGVKVVAFEDVSLPKGELDEVEEDEVEDDEEGDETLNEDKLLAERFVASPPTDRAHEDQVVQRRQHRGEDETGNCGNGKK